MLKDQNRYPKIKIRSKNELAKRISGKNLSKNEALDLINNVLKNYNSYWKDNISLSEPVKNKYVRNAKYTPLGSLLFLINKKILKPYDYMVPSFIFGGVSGKDHVGAVYNLIGKKRLRTKLALDVKQFYENNSRSRIFSLFYNKCECSKSASNLLADLCCVPAGAKGSNTKQSTLARGFAPSTRLALWCNLDYFLRAYWQEQRILKNKNPRFSVYVDDIAVTASDVSEEVMEKLGDKIEKIFSSDDKHKLEFNKSKRTIQSHTKLHVKNNMQQLGIVIGRNKLSLGGKSMSKQKYLEKKLSEITNKKERKSLMRKKKSYLAYKRHVVGYKNN